MSNDRSKRTRERLGAVHGANRLASKMAMPAVFASEVAHARIRHIWAVRNPGKLQPWRIASPEEPGTKQDRLPPGQSWHITTMED
jgi:aspartate oxidase